MAGLSNLVAAQAARAAAFADDEASIQATLQRLLQDHINEVLDVYPTSPPNGPAFGIELSRQMAQFAGDALRQDGDVLCAELLQAAIQLSQNVPDNSNGAINRFLCSTVQVIADRSADKATAFMTRLETVLLKLSQKQWYGGEQPLLPIDTGTFSTATDEPCLILFVGHQQVTVTFTEVLATFWESRLDTSCHECKLPIVGEPPIRTISSVNSASDPASAVHARVTNRHFSCLKASKASWVPVSHVWDESIRTANQLKAHHDDAASTVLKTLETLLDASLDAYDHGTEFWHDYFSVPQWDRPMQQALLLRIPSIYHDAQEILIHMPDLPGGYIMMLMPAGPSEFSATAALRFMPALHMLCSSQWMERMWVLLEYSLCRKACVMDKSDYVWRRAPADNRQGQGNNAADTFTTLVRNGHNVLLGFFRYAKSFASRLKNGFLAGLTDKQEQPRSLCLGEALELIARTKCQIFRDRFLAVNMLLHRHAPSPSDTIPESSVEACRWVWETALKKGDFSPLLLQPRERHQQSNPDDVGLLSYLTGYNHLDAAEWDLGDQRIPPQCTITFSPNGVIETEMDFVGEIEAIHCLDPEESGEEAGVGTAMEILYSLYTDRRLTAADLLDGMNRIFPFDVIHTMMAQIVANLAYTLEARQTQDRRFTSKLDRCIAEFMAAPPGGAQRRFIAQRVTQLLKYDTHVAGDLSAKITRLTKSRHIARSRRDRGAANGEPICAVRCPEASCRTLTVLRLDLRETGKVGDKVYRFPGLSYAETVENGVGLVLDDEGRITGRMRFGPPSCDCQVRRTVKIQ